MEAPSESLMLPGFDPEATTARDSGLSDAARATLQALKDAGELSPRHALTAQLLVAVSERAGIGLQAPRTTIATTNLVRLAADLLDKLPIESETVADAAAAFLAEVAKAEAEART